MSDLAQLLQIAPTTSAGFMGINQRQNEIESQLKQQELSQLIQSRMEKAARDAEAHPLDMESKRLGIRTDEARLPGITAESESNVLKAKAAGETYDSGVAATKAKNQGVVDDQQFEQFKRAQEVFLKAGPQLEGTAPPLRVSAFKKMLEGSGMKLDNPFVQSLMMMAAQNPDGFPATVQKAAEKMGQQALAMNPAAQASMANARLAASTRESIAGMREAGATARAGAKPAKGTKAVDTIGDVFAALKTGKVSPDKAIVALTTAKIQSQDPDEKKSYDDAIGMIEKFVYNKAGASKEGNLQLDSNGKLTPKTIDPVSEGNKPAVGQTKSGTKYQIISK